MKKVIPGTPRNNFDLPIAHFIGQLYLELYRLGNKIPKRDKFGLWSKVEQVCLTTTTLLLEAGLQSRPAKAQTIQAARLQIEVLKHLIRLATEAKIIDDQIYISLQAKLQEASKMACGWLDYAQSPAN